MSSTAGGRHPSMSFNMYGSKSSKNVSEGKKLNEIIDHNLLQRSPHLTRFKVVPQVSSKPDNRWYQHSNKLQQWHITMVLIIVHILRCIASPQRNPGDSFKNITFPFREQKKYYFIDHEMHFTTQKKKRHNHTQQKTIK